MTTLNLPQSKSIPGFSCVKMKQELQERIYRETEGMTGEEVRQYIRRKAEKVQNEKAMYWKEHLKGGDHTER